MYADALQVFYRREYESIPEALLKEVATALCEDILARNPLWRENRPMLVRELGEDAPEIEAEEEEEAARRRAARYMVARMQACGWFHFEYRSDRGGEVLNFYPYASRILTTLVHIARGEEPVLEGYTHDITTMLEPKTFARNPGLAIERVRQSTLEFVRELKTLERNIWAATRRDLERAVNAREVLEETFEKYQRQGGDNYHRLKTTENYYRVQRDVLSRLDVIERDFGLALEEAAKWYAAQLTLDDSESRAHVAAALELVRSHLDTLPALIADIDRRHAHFRGMARRKLSYFLRQEKDTGAKLWALIDRAITADAPDLPFALFRASFIGAGPSSLYTPRERRGVSESQPLAERPPMSDAAIAAERRRLLALLAFTPRELSRYVSNELGDRWRIGYSSLPLTDDIDYVRVILIAELGLRANAGYRMIPLRCTSRPGHSSDCVSIDCDECRVTVGPYRLPKGTLERIATNRRGSVGMAEHRRHP